MDRFIQVMLRYVERLDTQQWLLVFAGVIIVGVICLRGFGSRSSY